MSKPLADPFDSVALAARLAEARALRAIALANKKQLAIEMSRDVPNAGRADARAPPSPNKVLPDKPFKTSSVLRADPGMRVAFKGARGPAGSPAAMHVGPQTPDGSRSRGDLSPVLGIVAGCIIAGVAVLAFRLAPLMDGPGDVSRPGAGFQPSSVQAPAPLTSPVGRGLPIEQVTWVPTRPTVLDRQARSSQFMAASGRIDVATNQPEELMPRAPRPTAVATSPTPRAPRLHLYENAASWLIDRPPAPDQPPRTRPVEAMRMSALPAVRPPQTAPTPLSAPDESPSRTPVSTPRARAESAAATKTRAWADTPEYMVASEILRMAPGSLGRLGAGRSTSTSFRLTGLPLFGAAVGLSAANLRLDPDKPTSQSTVPSNMARARTAQPVPKATVSGEGRVARVIAVDKSQIERRVDRLLREQLRELRRR